MVQSSIQQKQDSRKTRERQVTRQQGRWGAGGYVKLNYRLVIMMVLLATLER